MKFICHNPRALKQDSDWEYLTENNDCSVCATSIALDKPYKTIHKTFKKHGRRWGKGVTIITLLAVINDLTKGKNKIVAHEWVRKITLATFVKENPTGNFIVVKKKHAFAVKNGIVYDTSERLYSPRSIVKYAFKVKEV